MTVGLIRGLNLQDQLNGSYHGIHRNLGNHGEDGAKLVRRRYRITNVDTGLANVLKQYTLRLQMGHLRLDNTICDNNLSD